MKKVLIICKTGKSANAVKDSIMSKDVNHSIEAISAANAGNYDEDDFDAILIAPQVSAHIDNLRHIFPTKPMEIAPFADYFSKNAPALIKMIDRMIN
ncbi:MAG: hypothetical protein GQ557_00185 [Mycoplasmataceae bacterium]|nr:hypothetical protein [Mycoplasmataceae bacterium]